MTRCDASCPPTLGRKSQVGKVAGAGASGISATLTGLALACRKSHLRWIDVRLPSRAIADNIWGGGCDDTAYPWGLAGTNRVDMTHVTASGSVMRSTGDTMPVAWRPRGVIGGHGSTAAVIVAGLGECGSCALATSTRPANSRGGASYIASPTATGVCYS